MEKFRATGFVGWDSLMLERFQSEVLQQGEIACLGKLIIVVRKAMEFVTINDDPMHVQTVSYSYNLSVRGRGTVFRCDNAHADEFIHPGCIDEHHQHFFNWKTGDELPDSPKPTAWPTLGDFIEMARDWYYENRAELSDPDAFVDPSELRTGVQW